MTRRAGILAAVLVLTIAAAPTLAAKLGDDAPPLKIEKWIKGGPLDVTDAKNTYVVEFWATWCAPCRAAIPHNTEMQHKLKGKGVQFVGVSVDGGPRHDTRDKVELFVQEQGDKMDYVVVLDTADFETKKAYMEAYEVRGIPTAFIVHKGKVAWLGHPIEIDKPLEEILTGSYDLAAAQKADEQRRQEEAKRDAAMKMMEKYFETVSQDNPENPGMVGTIVMMGLGEDAELLNDFSWQILTRDGIKHRDVNLALKAAEKAMKLSDSKSAAIVDTYARALFDSGKKEEAIKFQRKAVELAASSEMKAELEATLKQYEKAVQ